MKRHMSCPDYDFWDRQKEFTEFDLVHLWLDTEPPEEYQPSGKLRAIEKQLLQARMDGHLDWWSEQEDPGDYATYEVWYARKALIRYAESVGQRPAFLFPEDRTISSVHAVAPMSDSGLPHDASDRVRHSDHSSPALDKDSGSGMYTVKDFCKRHPEFKYGTVRDHIFYSCERIVAGQRIPAISV